MRYLIVLFTIFLFGGCFPPLPIQTETDWINIDTVLNSFLEKNQYTGQKVAITKLFPLDTETRNTTFQFQIKELNNGNYRLTGSRLLNKYHFVIDKSFKFALFNDVRLESLYLEGNSPYYFNLKYKGVKFKEQYNGGYIMLLMLEDGRFGFVFSQFDYGFITLDETIILN